MLEQQQNGQDMTYIMDELNDNWASSYDCKKIRGFTTRKVESFKAPGNGDPVPRAIRCQAKPKKLR